MRDLVWLQFFLPSCFSKERGARLFASLGREIIIGALNDITLPREGMGGKVALSVGIVPWECWDAAGYELLSRLTSRAGDHTFKKKLRRPDAHMVYVISI